MANTGVKGIDVRQSGTALVFRAFLQTSAGALVTSGTTNLYIMELQSDGSILTYDFSSNTFKSTGVTTEFLGMNYKKSNNGTTDTGLWTAALATLTGFTVGAIYIVRINNAGASPTDQMREFQFGSDQGDLITTAVSTGVADLQVTPDFAVTLPASPTVNTVGESMYATAIMIGRNNTAQAGSSNTITLDAGASTVAGSYIGDAIWLYAGTGGGGPGSGQYRTIIAYNTSTLVATVNRAWTITPDNTTKFMTIPNPKSDPWLWLGGTIPAPSQTGVPITDVHYTQGTSSAGAAGYMGIDWSAIHLPNSTVNLSATTIATVTGQLTAAAIATALWTDVTSGDFATVGSPGHILVTQLGGTFTTTSSSIFTALSLANAPGGGGGSVVLASNGLDNVITELGINARQSLSLILSATTGESIGVAAGTPTYYAAGQGTTIPRIVATAINGDRSIVVLTPPT
jgi:hypothetical protein